MQGSRSSELLREAGIDGINRCVAHYWRKTLPRKGESNGFWTRQASIEYTIHLVRLIRWVLPMLGIPVLT
jgi:hypothetical protein